ncbi:MAG: ABC transporter ATP-binding protein [Hyphomonadaceae bacterium]|nr:ABC transporter ATP-binding protein [Hyphomonadaceae bacterium]
MSAPLLQVADLRVAFRSGQSWSHAVDGVSFDIARGEILGCVGESGSGKSATATALLGLLPPRAARVSADALVFDGRDMTRLSEKEWLSLRGREVAFAPQDPMSALNPIMRIGRHMRLIQPRIAPREAHAAAASALQRMGFADPETILRAYPFQLSGGQRQRALLAMALLAKPKLLIADEPTTALDVTVQAQILDLIESTARADGLSVLFITHNLGVAQRLCDRLIVMRTGTIVESGATSEILSAPQHAYTRALLAALPGAAPPRTRLTQRAAP